MKKLLIMLASLIIVIYLSCAPKPVPMAPEAAKAPEAVAVSLAKEGWEIEWERVQSAARKEGKVVFYTTAGPEMRLAFAEALKKYGIALESVVGRPGELQERALRERRAGIYHADLYRGGLSSIVEVLKPSGCLVSYRTYANFA